MDYKLYANHLLKSHIYGISKEEYLDFLRLIFKRIAKNVKYKSKGFEIFFEPSMKINIFAVQKFKEIEKSTCQHAQIEEEDKLFDYRDSSDGKQT